MHDLKPDRYLMPLKVLVELFQKLARVEAADASSPSQRRNALARFFLPSFFFAPVVSKKKRVIG